MNLYLPGSTSLKEKRRLLKSLQDKMRNKFNLAVAEVDRQENWQHSVLAAASVSNQRYYLEKIFNRVVNLVDDMPGIELMRSEIIYY